MTIKRKTIIDQLELTRDNTVQVRLMLLLVEGDKVLSHKYHRTAIPVGVPACMQMAEVNTHLHEMGEERLPNKEVLRIEKFCDFCQTPSE